MDHADNGSDSLVARLSENKEYTNLLAHFCVEPVQTECLVQLWLWRIVAPILLVFGFCGNILNLIVLSRKTLRQHSATVYLRFLAIADLIVLTCSIPRQFLLRFEIEMKSLSSLNCVMHEWVAYTAGGFSGWLVALLTVERTLFTVKPLWARRNVTPMVSLMASMVCLFIISIFTCHLLIAYELKTTAETVYTDNNTIVIQRNVSACLPKSDEHQNFINGMWRILVFLIFNIIPLLFIVFGNSIVATILLLRKRHRLFRVYPEVRSDTLLDHKLYSAAKMLFFLCSCFILTTIPYTLFAVLKNTVYNNVTDDRLYAKLQLALTIVYLLLYFNYSCNFVLYVLSGSLFRRESRLVILSMKKYVIIIFKKCTGQ